jgi:hypothetical protein
LVPMFSGTEVVDVVDKISFISRFQGFYGNQGICIYLLFT